MVLKEIKERYSVRSFSNRQPSDEQIQEILEAGRIAPSWMNVQPWHFIVINDKETRELLSKLAHGQPHVASVPVVIACCGDTSAWEHENFKKTLESRSGITEERINTLLTDPTYNQKLKGKDTVLYRTIEELTYPIAYMTLEAKDLGLDTCIVGAIGNDLTESLPKVYQQVRQRLNLPDHIILITLLLLGYSSSDSKNPPKLRKTPEEIFSFEKYGKKNA
ncbi:MAG: nitroreductase family protein [Candidatus Gastranaerophilales bacterium]|nr:nitroreductase family protein [Candidatus Gastranaerophilales bacterium]